jgi:predicted small metal-binding protein
MIYDMTKSISCADSGADCNWTASAETEEQLMEKVAQHAKTDHPGMKITPDLVAKIKSIIKEI